MQKLTYLPKEKVTAVWSNEEIVNIKKLLSKKHLLYLENETFEIDSGTLSDQIQICISLIKNDKSTYYPIECIFIKESNHSIKETEIAFTMLDYVDLYWENYFSEERNVFIPLDWSKHEFEGVSFYMRGFVRNLHLESQAEAYLLKHGHGEYDIHSISSET